MALEILDSAQPKPLASNLKSIGRLNLVVILNQETSVVQMIAINTIAPVLLYTPIDDQAC